MHISRSWLCLPATALTVVKNWASSSSKLAIYSSFTIYIYSGSPIDKVGRGGNHHVTPKQV